ncbi:MAG: class I SAM-dependent methyltransferase [Spirochaetes bacterium]|nr:class I SAM-dependent methyltransferase [Spirochaetota bacterium]
MDFLEYSKTFLHFYSDEVPDLLSEHLPAAGKKSTVVDLGCGDGAFLIALFQKGYLDNARAIGVDLSNERIERLKHIDNIEAYCADVNDVREVQDGSVDFIICTQVIEHVPDDSILAGEIFRQLKPGGRAYVASLIKRWYGWFYYRTRHGKWALDPTHEREYESAEELENVLKNAGFIILETKTSQLKLSILEFLIRRVLIKFIRIRDTNNFFVRHRILNFIRNILMLPIPGYLLLEIMVEKPK